jgi:hypothetical protein
MRFFQTVGVHMAPKSSELTAVLSRHSFGAKADGIGHSANRIHVAKGRWFSFGRPLRTP